MRITIRPLASPSIGNLFSMSHFQNDPLNHEESGLQKLLHLTDHVLRLVNEAVVSRIWHFHDRHMFPVSSKLLDLGPTSTVGLLGQRREGCPS